MYSVCLSVRLSLCGLVGVSAYLSVWSWVPQSLHHSSPNRVGRWCLSQTRQRSHSTSCQRPFWGQNRGPKLHLLHGRRGHVTSSARTWLHFDHGRTLHLGGILMGRNCNRSQSGRTNITIRPPEPFLLSKPRRFVDLRCKSRDNISFSQRYAVFFAAYVVQKAHSEPSVLMNLGFDGKIRRKLSEGQD